MPVWQLLPEAGPQPLALLRRAQRLEAAGWVLTGVERERFVPSDDHPELFERIAPVYTLERDFRGSPLKVTGPSLLKAIEFAERLSGKPRPTGPAVPIASGVRAG